MDAVTATIEMADAQARMGLIDDAVVELRKAVRIFPRNLELHEKLGILLAKQERYEAALPHLQKVLRKNNKKGELLMLAGNCALSTGRAKEAGKLFERCIAISWKVDEATANIGRALIARNKAQQAWNILHSTFVEGASSSEEIHTVLEMCAQLVGGQVPAMASAELGDASSAVSLIGAVEGSLEAMAGIMQENLVVEEADMGSDLFEEEDVVSVARLRISLPGKGLDAPESRARWQDSKQEKSILDEQWQDPSPSGEGWIKDDHWDSIPLPGSTLSVKPQQELQQIEVATPSEGLQSLTESVNQAKTLTEEELEDVGLPFGIGKQSASSSERESSITLQSANDAVSAPEEAEVEARAMQEMPMVGKPVVATEGRALSQLARMAKPKKVWCWTTSYGEVPWGLELLKSRLSDRPEVARAELHAWTKQNPNAWLAVDMQRSDRVPVDIETVAMVIEGLAVPVVIIVEDDQLETSWPLWGAPG